MAKVPSIANNISTDTIAVSSNQLFFGDLLLKTLAIAGILIIIMLFYFGIRGLNNWILERFRKHADKKRRGWFISLLIKLNARRDDELDIFPVWAIPSIFFIFLGVMITLFPLSNNVNLFGLHFPKDEIKDIKIALGVAFFLYALLEVPIFFDHLENFISHKISKDLTKQLRDSRRADIKEMLSDVFHYLFKVKHSQKTIKELDFIISNPFARTNYLEKINIVKNLNGELDPFRIKDFKNKTGENDNAPKNLFFLIRDVSYILTNISKKPEEFTFVLTVEPLISGKKPYISHLIFGEEIDLSDESIFERSYRVAEDIFITTYIPKIVNPGEEIYVRYKCIRTVGNYGRLPIFFSHITQEPRFTVCESAFRNFNVEILSNRSSEANPEKNWLAGKKECHIDRAFLPGQGTTLFWKRKLT